MKERRHSAASRGALVAIPWAVATAALAAAAPGCLIGDNPAYCEDDRGCQGGKTCDTVLHRCFSPDSGGADASPDVAPADTAGMDSRDAAADSAPDAAPDAAPDSTAESAADAPVESLADAPSETEPEDAPPDMPLDAPPDMSPDAPPDMMPDGPECISSAGCTERLKPVCLNGACVSCTAPSATCPAATPVCVASGTDAGACVECINDTHCSAPTKPICVTSTGTCRACGSGSECSNKSSGTRSCLPSGQCVECSTHAECNADPAKPICNTTSNQCRACAADSECGTKDPQGPLVCTSAGTCASALDVIFARGTASCPGNGAQATPYCLAQSAMTRLTMTGETRRIVVLRGVVEPWDLAAAISGVTIIGQESARVAVGTTATAGVRLAGGVQVLVRDLEVSGGTVGGGFRIEGTGTDVSLLRVRVRGNAGIGVDAASAKVLRMNRCWLENNAAGGIRTQLVDWDITNSVVVFNGSTGTTGTMFGGVWLGAGASGTPQRFLANAVVSNKARDSTEFASVRCDGPYNVQSSILHGNLPAITGFSTNLCMVTYSNVDIPGLLTSGAENIAGDPLFDTATGKEYHLTATSPCRDKGHPTEFPPDDYDGETRPHPTGGRSDCGADEYR